MKTGGRLEECMNEKTRIVKRAAVHGRGRTRSRIFLLAGIIVALAALQLPALTVLSPNGGESWVIGSRATITWTPTAAGVNVRVSLYRGGTDGDDLLGHIVDSVSGAAGSCAWTAGETAGGPAPEGTDYYVRVKVVGEEESDFSNSAFALRMPTITVTSPMETAAYEASTSSMNVAWTFTDLSGNVRIDLERQDGAERYVIDDSVAVTGSPVTWPIPLATAAGTYRVKISQGAIEGISGRCHIMAYRPPGLTVLQPNGGEELVMGSSYQVRWQPHHLEGNVRVELLNSGRLVGALSESVPVGDCSLRWYARECGGHELIPNRGFKIRVTTLDGLHTDTSDGSFALTSPSSITLYDPNKGETWVSDTIEEIRWNTMKMDGYLVTIDLEFPDPDRPTGWGGFLIARDVPANDRRFSWTVGTILNDPARLAFRVGIKRDCHIRLRATKGTSVITSEGPPFKIKTLE